MNLEADMRHHVRNWVTGIAVAGGLMALPGFATEIDVTPPPLPIAPPLVGRPLTIEDMIWRPGTLEPFTPKAPGSQPGLKGTTPSQPPLPNENYPPSPTPPTPPPGVKINSFYSTCGGYHPPVVYSFPEYKRNEDGSVPRDTYGRAQLDPETEAYINSPEYKKYTQELNEYKQKYAKSPGYYGEVDPETGKRVSVSNEQSNSLGNAVTKLDRDPMRDLATWMRGFQYHDTVNPISYGDSNGELNSSLSDPLAGPALSASHYGRLVSWLSPELQAAAPSPKDLVLGVEKLWATEWRKALGFDADPGSRTLAADLERATADRVAARRRLDELGKRTETDQVAKFKLIEQRAFAAKEFERAFVREKALVEVWNRRADFLYAMDSLLRLVPDGGFGPTFHETIEPKSAQNSALKVLRETGPIAAYIVWKGLAEDVTWKAKLSSFTRADPAEVERRNMAIEKATEALCDTRIDGLPAVVDFLNAKTPAEPAVIRKALELLDKTGARLLRREMLTALPRVIELRASDDAQTADLANWTLQRLMSARGAKVSMEDAIGTLAPLLKEGDANFSEAVWQFLKANTGQPIAKDAKAWLDLQTRMITEREKVEAAKKNACR